MVKVSLQAWNLTRAGSAIKLKIRDEDGLLIGTAEIGQGTFGWKGAKSKRAIKRVPWRQFAADFQKWHRRRRPDSRTSA
jgi:hypothetical protein